MSDDLPEGWRITTLGVVAEVNPRHPKDLDGDLMVTFVPMPVVSESDWNLAATQERPFCEVKTGYTHFAEGDVLFAKITPCMENGKAAIATHLRNGLGCGSTELHVLRPYPGIDPKYLYHFVHQESFRREAANNFTGTAGQLRVPVDFMRTAEIPLAPTAEQRRIVAQIEALRSKVRSSQERLDKFPTILKRFRKAVLAAGASGHLTEDWRQEHPCAGPAAEFVRRIQEERRRDYDEKAAKALRSKSRSPKSPKNNFVATVDENMEGLPSGWCAAGIGDVSDCLDYLRVPINKAARAARQGQIPYYGANGQVGWIDKFLFDEDLVLVVEDETFIGREKPFSYVIRGKAWVNNHAHVLRPIGGIPVDYLNICLSYYDFTPLTSGTTGRRKLNQEALLDAPLWIAPRPEQEEIVHRVSALLALADRLEARHEKAKAQVDRLTPSILAKAFGGELVATEAAQAKAEGRSYETAAELLAHIKAHQSTSKPAPTTKKVGVTAKR